MKKDRDVIRNVISKMLDNPDCNGVYPTNEACNELEAYVGAVRSETTSYMYGKACMMLDNNEDIRLAEAPSIYYEVVYALTGERV